MEDIRVFAVSTFAATSNGIFQNHDTGSGGMMESGRILKKLYIIISYAIVSILN